jgi:hypothetical protein
MAEYPSLVVVFLRALTTASPRRWPRSAPLWGKAKAQAQRACEEANRR